MPARSIGTPGSKACPRPVIAEIELEEQAGLRITSNVVGCDPETVRIGMSVKVEFDHVGETWIPVFRP